MNIFFLNSRPTRCARWHCDKHVVKMILETTQILYTCQHANGGTENVEKSAPICLSTGKRGYKKHAVNHPSVKWARSSLSHYYWLCWLGLALVKEYEFRFNNPKPHSCLVHLIWLVENFPSALTETRWLSDPTPAMPDEFKNSNSVVKSYIAYYKGSKTRMLKWTKRHTPHVFLDSPI